LSACGRSRPIDTLGLGQEGRGQALRERRDQLAAWFDVPADTLLGLPPEVLEAMAQRIEAERSAAGELAQLRATVQRWEELARTDALTGLANRRAAEERLAQECARAARYHHPLTVLLADVDRLKSANDTHGHDAGDVVLHSLAERLSRVVRGADLVARWGGDEFLVICPETDALAAEQVAAKLVRVAGDPVVAAGHRLQCGISVGWACCDGDVDPVQLLRAADEALYRSKQQGRGRASGSA
jgi:two-component system cell cycle response regulator